MPAPLIRDSLKVASLFSGIGGFEIGLARAGHKTVLFCEIDPAACAVLRAKFPRVRIHDDVRTLKSLPRNVQLVTSGFPCQDLSPVGRTAGALGGNSRLVFEAFRLVKKARPNFV